MRRKFILFSAIVFALSAGLTAGAQAPAFPGAEGHGKYVQGGRGGRVIEVTNLDDSGEGSLRAAVEASGARTVVFRVSGYINLESELTISNDSITIAGQTAPGDGITLRNFSAKINASEVIIRFMRFRMGDARAYEGDAIWTRGYDHIIIDHCSMSWSTDECVSFYQNEYFTMQWCIIAESLRNSVHEKGSHGYGGIWGGRYASFHHNMLAHHSSRNPRLGEYKGDVFALTDLVDLRNNVLYNWGGQTCYGGEAMNVNIVNCYYKPGPASSNVSRIYAPDKLTEYGYPITDIWGKFYIDGNVLTTSADATEDNWTYGVYNQINSAYGILTEEEKEGMRMSMPHNPGEITTHTAHEAYDLVRLHGGASLVRDSVDLRILHEVSTGTVTYPDGGNGSVDGIIDTQEAVGGWPVLESLPAPLDTDKDGMPDAWEIEKGLDPEEPEDRNGDRTSDGYTNLEEYLNSLVDIPWDMEPMLMVASPLPGDGFLLEDTVKISAYSSVNGSGSIASFELFLDDELVLSQDSGTMDTILTELSTGARELKFRATDERGNVAVDSMKIYVGTVRYDLSIVPGTGEGQVRVEPGGSSFVEGTELSLQADPAFSYRFKEWTGDVLSQVNPLAVTMDGNQELIVNFERDTGTYARINFQKPDDDNIEGYYTDDGRVFGEQYDGLRYGWVGSANYTAIHRSGVDDPRKATFNQMQRDGDAIWEMALPDGNYSLLLHMGDGRLTSQVNSITAEGVELVDDVAGNYFDEFYLPSLTVSDGALTLVPTGDNAKIDFLKIGAENHEFYRYVVVVNGTGDGDYPVGSTVGIEANGAGTSMAFLEWTGDTVYLDDPEVSPASLVMPDQDLVLTATYWTPVYRLTVNHGVGSGEYEPGDQVFIVADEPAEGYEFIGWEVISGETGAIASPDASFTWVIMPESDLEISALYQDATGIHGKVPGQETKLRCYPNPASGEVILEREGSEPALIRIFDAGGRILKSLPMKGSTCRIATSDLPRGVCILKVIEENTAISVVKLLLK